MPRNFILNLLAATAQILLNLYAYARQCKFFKILRRSDIARCVHIAKHTAKRCFRKIRLHEIPHAKSLSRTLRSRYVSFWRATRLLVRQISRHAAQVRTPLQSRHLRSRTFRSGFWCAAKLSARTRLEPKLPQHKLGLRGKPNFSGKAKPPPSSLAYIAARCLVSDARRDLKFRYAAANFKIPKS